MKCFPNASKMLTLPYSRTNSVMKNAIILNIIHNILNRISGIIVDVLASSAIDCGFEPRSGQTKDYKIGICCFSTKHATLRRKSRDSLAWNQNNVSERSDMSICRLLFQWANTFKNPTQRVGLEQSGPHHHLNEN